MTVSAVRAYQGYIDAIDAQIKHLRTQGHERARELNIEVLEGRLDPAEARRKKQNSRNNIYKRIKKWKVRRDEASARLERLQRGMQYWEDQGKEVNQCNEQTAQDAVQPRVTPSVQLSNRLKRMKTS